MSLTPGFTEADGVQVGFPEVPEQVPRSQHGEAASSTSELCAPSDPSPMLCLEKAA